MKPKSSAAGGPRLQTKKDAGWVVQPRIVVPVYPREIARCGCKNQEIKLHYPIILERNRDGTFWTWSDCCCHALDPDTGMTKWCHTEKAAIKFARRYFGFRHNSESIRGRK